MAFVIAKHFENMYGFRVPGVTCVVFTVFAKLTEEYQDAEFFRIPDKYNINFSNSRGVSVYIPIILGYPHIVRIILNFVPNTIVEIPSRSLT